MRVTRNAALIATMAALLVVLPLIANLTGNEFYVGQLRRVLIIAIAAVSLDLILGYGGMVSLGHAAFLGVGAYVVAILHHHHDRETLFLGLLPGTTSILVTWPLAALVAGALAALIGLVSLRTSGIYFIMITLAFAQMIYFFFVSLRAYGGDDGLRFPGDASILGPFNTEVDIFFYYVVLAALALVLLLLHRLSHARFGRVLQGIRENERRMRALGFATFRYKLAAFALAGAIAGWAGALLAHHESYVSPALMHWTRSGDLVVMVVLGGIGTLFGPVAGTIVFLALEKFLPDYTEHWMIVFGPILIAIVLFARRGLLGLVVRARDAAPRHG